MSAAEHRKYITVLDFRHPTERRKSPGPLGRRGLLWLILLMGVVFVLFEDLRRPGGCQWLDRLTEVSPEATGGGIDNRLPPARGQDADSFIIGQPRPPAEKPVPEEKGYFPGVDPAMLDSVRDDTVSSQGERACSMSLLNILNKADQKELRQASVGKVTYAQLFHQSTYYRGRLVTIAGVVHRVNPIELPENKYNIREYYQIWIATNDNPTAPVVVYCLHLPEDFPTGMKVSEEAAVTGFYFKRWAYESEDGLRTAPTILAKTLQWKKRPAIAQEPAVNAGNISLVVVIAAILALLAAWYVYLRTRPTHPALPDSPPDFDVLKEMDQRNESTDES